MNMRTLLSIVLSASLFGGVIVLLFVSEPTVAIILLAVGITGQLVAKVLKSRKRNMLEQVAASQPSAADDSE